MPANCASGGGATGACGRQITPCRDIKAVCAIKCRPWRPTSNRPATPAVWRQPDRRKETHMEDNENTTEPDELANALANSEDTGTIETSHDETQEDGSDEPDTFPRSYV